MNITPQELKYFADYIESQLGIVYAPENYYQLETRLKNIADFLSLPDANAVYKKAITKGINGTFKQFLLDTSTNNETSFFRDFKVFQIVEEKILPSLQVSFPNSFNYRIWCCAASFGQEPYSLAMLVHEFLEKNPKHPPIEIIATDIAEHALKRCHEGVYSHLEVQRGLSSVRLLKYFTKNDSDHWVLKPEVKNRVKFQTQNLLEPFAGMGIFHLIFCRYVLIYQDNERRKQIIKRLEKCLRPNGYFILGASESALGVSETLLHVAESNVVFYQRN
ncbi:MAG: protein-glutamate O-methyltransferase CheR [Bacteriovoracaceae bacterium]|nr:protein-glutamate O-methyltransferase CheR [Bacteriovoracaceae bacterium]